MSGYVPRDDSEAQAKWNSDAALRREFKTFGAYRSYCKAERNTHRITPRALKTPTKEQEAKALWDADAAIRSEFKTFGAYWGFCQVMSRKKVGA